MMGIVATAVFCFMLIQLWSNYGDDIKKRVFSPQIAGAGKFDLEGEDGDVFGMDFHKWENTTLHINMSKPKHDLIQLDLMTPQEWSYEWVDASLSENHPSACRQGVIDGVEYLGYNSTT